MKKSVFARPICTVYLFVVFGGEILYFPMWTGIQRLWCCIFSAYRGRTKISVLEKKGANKKFAFVFSSPLGRENTKANFLWAPFFERTSFLWVPVRWKDTTSETLYPCPHRKIQNRSPKLKKRCICIRLQWIQQIDFEVKIPLFCKNTKRRYYFYLVEDLLIL